MKATAYTRYKYSGELYKYVTKQVGDDQIQEYYFTGVVPLKAIVDFSGQLRLQCPQSIPVGSVINNIKDSNGQLLLEGQPWEITGLEPIVNAFNAIEEYRLRAIKFAGEL